MDFIGNASTIRWWRRVGIRGRRKDGRIPKNRPDNRIQNRISGCCLVIEDYVWARVKSAGIRGEGYWGLKRKVLDSQRAVKY